MAVAWSYHPDAAAATGEVAGVLLEARDGRAPDLLWVAVGSEHLPDFPEIVGGLRALLEPGAAIGATVHRIPGSPADVRRRAGIAVAAVDIAHGDITVRRTAPGESPTVPDPGSVRLGYTVEARIASVVADGPDALIAAASGPRGRPGLLALDADIRAGGMVAVDFGPASRPALTVAPACVPIGPDLTVTAATGPVVRSLGSRPPASYVIEALGLDDAPGPDLIDRLCVGVLADPTVVEPEIADLVALRVLACDSESGSFTIAGDVGTGATARLLLRDENAVLTPLSSAVADPGRAALVAVGPDAELGDARHPVGRVVEEHRDVPIAAAVHTGITVTSASRRRNGALAVAAVTFRTSAEHGVRSSGA